MKQSIKNRRYFLHQKSGGKYELLMIAVMEADLTRACVYQSIDNGSLWVRPESEFFDGRFKELVDG
jgi:hypothetical protein